MGDVFIEGKGNVRRKQTRVARFAFVASSALLALTSQCLPAQQAMSKADRDTARTLLHDAYDAVKKNYYDPKLHGLDWEARLREYDTKIGSAATLGEALGVVEGFLEGLNDAHTHYVPPPSASRIEPGFAIEMIGDLCFVTGVRPGTDGAAKLHPGDQVVGFAGYAVTREDFARIRYSFSVFAPQTAVKLELRDPQGQEREVTVAAKTQDRRSAVDSSEFGGPEAGDPVREREYRDHPIRERLVEKGDVVIWKMPEFRMRDSEIDSVFQTIRKHQTLILDLRGNPGGTLSSLERLAANLFDHDLKVADRVSRKESKPQLAKSRGANIFSGKLIVLVDSDTASAAELLARLVQIEKRGTVIGDRTAGSVREARHYPYSRGLDQEGSYDFSVTESDLVPPDGKSLEDGGVAPDETVLPTAEDLARGQDPALARAAGLAGLELDAVAAGKIFPIAWPG